MKYGKKKSKKVPLVGILVIFVLAGLFVYLINNDFFLDGKNGEGVSNDIEEPSAKVLEGGNNPDQSEGSFQARRSIHDRNMEVLAQSVEVASIYIRPLELRDRHVTIVRLADLLDLDIEALMEDLRTERSFIWLKHNVSREKAQSIRGLNLDGVYLVNEGRRYYPFKSHASHVLGYAEKENGLAGIEFIYDSILRGDNFSSSLQFETIPENERDDLEISALVASIDIDVQILLEAKLELLLKKVDGETGSAVLMDAKNGQIYAMANMPAFDPNLFWKADNYARKNRAIDATFKLGGLSDFFKVAAEIYSGNKFSSELFDNQEVAQRIIEPRQMKKIMGEKASGKSGWQKWGKDDYVAPLMHWPNGFSAESGVITDFCEEIGIGDKSYLSDQNWQKNQEIKRSQKCDATDPTLLVDLMGLTSGFSQLINGGSIVQPKVLHSVWLDTEKRFLGENVSTLKKGIGAPVSENIKEFLKSYNSPGTRELIFVEAFNSAGSIEEEVDIDGVSSANATKIVSETSPVERRGNSILIGGEINGDKQLVIGLIVEGARISTEDASPFRKFGYEVVSKGKKLLVRNEKNRAGSPKTLSYQEAYAKWSKGQNSKSTLGTSVTRIEKKDVMPDLKGLSLRKAFQDINGFNLHISIQGAGKIVRQSIKAGSKIKNDQNLLLELKY